MYKRMHTPVGKSAKLLGDWLGPYRIVEVVSPQNVIIRQVAGLKTEDKRVHIAQLKLYMPETPKIQKAKPKLLKVGDVVWAKVKYAPYWPAKIVDKSTVQLKKPVKPNELIIQFFNKNGLDIVQREHVFDYLQHKHEFQSKAAGLKNAVHSAEKYLNKEVHVAHTRCVRPDIRY